MTKGLPALGERTISGISSIMSSIISSVTRGLSALGELPALWTGTISGSFLQLTTQESESTGSEVRCGDLSLYGRVLFGAQGQCCWTSAALLDQRSSSTINTACRSRFNSAVRPRGEAVVQVLQGPGAPESIARPRRLSAVDSFAGREAAITQRQGGVQGSVG